MDFATRYKNLNTQQQKAVDLIDGPVMVIAGPGTGKTELLSMRTATILKRTDTLPESILCLTFTDSGAHAMRERLAQIIGKDAYKVAIHTFHSFGSELINQNGEYFYQGAHFRPADDLTTFEIITSILDDLEYDNVLAGKMNGEYTHLRDVISTISDLKRSGLTSDELRQIVSANDGVLDAIEPKLAEIFSVRISTATVQQLAPCVHEIAALSTEKLPGAIPSLSSTLALSLAHAVDEATDTESTKPITAWKNKWLTKDVNNKFVFKDRKRHEKLRAMSAVYFQYLTRMQEAELFDYDDMILRVTHALEVFDDLRFTMQEKYQYIMVDEFQDTNLAQMRILHNLTNNPVFEGKPNILVVGDDDQAVYSFQGADISNIMSFRTQYPQAELIPLVDNYRSGEAILDVARSIITQGSDRLERHIDELDKTLRAHTHQSATVTLYESSTENDERKHLVAMIKKEIAAGRSPSDIAVLTRRHREIIELLPYFSEANIDVAYERRDNVLELEPIALLVQLARFVTLLVEQHIDDADRMLPELLAHPAWHIATPDLWQLSLKAYDNRQRWLDAMASLPAFQPLHQLLTQLAVDAQTEPLELMLDKLMGNASVATQDGTCESPLFSYYFSSEKLEQTPSLYLRYLEGLRTIRTALREHQAEGAIRLNALIEFIDLYERTGNTLTSVQQLVGDQTNSINLMTAHKSKGLEFTSVYIVGAVDTMWGERVRSRSRLISYPENLPLENAGDSFDERLRLFFVAATRAKQRLTISYAQANDAGKPLERASFLAELSPKHAASHVDNDKETPLTEHWYTRLTEPAHDMHTLLQPFLKNYKLSATHLGNFLDVTRGGPQAFLVHTMLRFPQAMSPAAAYGSALHTTLQHTHAHLAATGKQRAVEDVLRDFETELAQHRLRSDDFELYSQKGSSALQAFLTARYDTFTRSQKVELNFAGQQSVVDNVHMTGKLDLVDINTAERTMKVTDYKSGHPSRSWKGKTDYEKMKLHRYRQQLLFYKLLVEHSRDYSTYTVTDGCLQFVEPSRDGEILALDDDFSSAELADFQRLLVKVWQKITTLDFPNTDHYDQTYKGLCAFEQDLLDENV